MLPDLSFHFLVRHDGSGFAHHHPSPHVFPLQASDQSAQVISCLGPVQRLVEHLNTWTGEKRGSLFPSNMFQQVRCFDITNMHIALQLFSLYNDKLLMDFMTDQHGVERNY